MPLFKPPRKPLTLTYKRPRQIAKEVKPELVEEDERLPLDDWHEGFSVNGAITTLQHYGPLMPRPREEPQMVDDISAVEGDGLGQLYGLFVYWTAYLEEQVCLLDLAASESAGRLDHVKAAIRLKKSGTVADRDAKALNDPEFIEAEMPVFTAQAKAKLLRARLRGYEKIAAALSREITRREKLLEHQ